MFLVGDKYYGKVDHVRGEFFVATRFLHNWGVPIIPRETLLFIDDGKDGIASIRIPFSWRSAIAAWMRGLLWFFIVWCFLMLGLVFESKKEPWLFIFGFIASVAAVEAVLITLLWATYRLTSCSPTRADALRGLFRHVSAVRMDASIRSSTP